MENDLPRSLWDETINIANYVLNRYLIRLIHKKTPYEMFKAKKPNISYVKAFGNKCFIHTNCEENLSEFNARSDEDIIFFIISLLVKHIVYTINAPSSLRNVFILYLVKLTMVFTVHFHLMSFS